MGNARSICQCATSTQSINATDACTALQEADLSLSQLEAIACTQGPGSFTGVRMSLSVAQSLAFAQDLPIIGISTLQALAQSAVRLFAATHVLAGLDARMQEVYWGAFALGQEGLVQPLDKARVLKPENVIMS
jgi:tRNA threonylcarbamoyladenosine biosynthesis protein TsaB